MKRHLLVIGNANYDNGLEFPHVPYTVTDTSNVYELLTASPHSLFSSLTSVCRQDVTRREFEDILQEFFSRVDKSDLILIYFAGHARKVAGRLFLIMKNSTPSSLASTAFNTESLQPYLEEKQIWRYIVVLDCCQAAQAFKSPGVRARGLMTETNLENLSGSGKIYVASAREYELAHELESLGHGLFSHYFIHGLETGQAVDKSERFISITDICNYVRTQIEKEHPDIGQEPVMSGQDFAGEMVIAENPGFIPADPQQVQILEAVKRTLKLSDLSNAEELQRARVENLRHFIGLVADFSSDLVGGRVIVEEHAVALGLDPLIVKQEFEAYVRSLQFNEGEVSPETLTKHHGRGLAVLASSSSLEASYEIQEFKSGLFSHFLREALLGRAANSEGVVTVTSAFSYVHSAVKRFGSVKQGPQLHTVGLSGDPILTGSQVDWKNNAGRRVALIAGTNSFNDPHISGLKYAESDAQSMASLLQDVGGFDCRLLLGSQATSMNLKHALSAILSGLNSDDTFLFYFTGNGGYVNEGKLSLVLADFDSRHYPETQVELSYLKELLDVSLVGTSIIVLDTCFAGAASTSLK